MPSAVKISDRLYCKAKATGKAVNRSTAGQIEFWAKIGQVVEDNHDLNFNDIQGILIGLEEVNAGLIEPLEI